MANLKTGTTAPTGITLAGTAVLIHDVKYNSEPQNVLSDDHEGKYYGGKLIKKKMNIIVTGEILESGKAALLALRNTGDATAASPRVGDIEMSEPNETQHKFTLNAHYFVNTQAVFRPA